jgi:hypothetical protein
METDVVTSTPELVVDDRPGEVQLTSTEVEGDAVEARQDQATPRRLLGQRIDRSGNIAPELKNLFTADVLLRWVCLSVVSVPFWMGCFDFIVRHFFQDPEYFYLQPFTRVDFLHQYSLGPEWLIFGSLLVAVPIFASLNATKKRFERASRILRQVEPLEASVESVRLSEGMKVNLNGEPVRLRLVRKSVNCNSLSGESRLYAGPAADDPVLITNVSGCTWWERTGDVIPVERAHRYLSFGLIVFFLGALVLEYWTTTHSYNSYNSYYNSGAAAPHRAAAVLGASIASWLGSSGLIYALMRAFTGAGSFGGTLRVLTTAVLVFKFGFILNPLLAGPLAAVWGIYQLMKESRTHVNFLLPKTIAAVIAALYVGYNIFNDCLNFLSRS